MTNGRAQGSGGAVATAGAPTRRAAEDLRDLLTRSTLAIERHRAAIGRQLALGDSEMHALACLDQHGELTPGELRARLSLSSGGTTALVQRLERAGHVERRGHPRDRRSVVISLSPATRELLRSSAEPLVAAIDAAAAELSPGQRATVAAWLGRIVRAAEQEAGDAASDDGDADGGPVVPNSWF